MLSYNIGNYLIKCQSEGYITITNMKLSLLKYYYVHKYMILIKNKTLKNLLRIIVQR